MIKHHLKEEVARATRLFWEKGLTPGQDSGDTSLRDQETGYVYICPRPDDKLKIPNWGVIKADDIAVMDLEGNLLEDNGILATVEAPMHLAIYKARPEINAIIHSHATFSSCFAITGKNIPLALAEQALFLGGEIACAAYGKVGSTELAANIVKALGGGKMAALMRNHGAVCLGKDFEEAFIVSDFLEKGAQTVIYASILGKVIAIDPDDILDESLL
jgi:L-fuculose-phosphate aldolase